MLELHCGQKARMKHTSKVMKPRVIKKCKMKKKVIYVMQSYGSYTLNFYSMRYISLQRFLLLYLVIEESCPEQSSECTIKMTLSSKLGKTEV